MISLFLPVNKVSTVGAYAHIATSFTFYSRLICVFTCNIKHAVHILYCDDHRAINDTL
jgi:hypothetical protein